MKNLNYLLVHIMIAMNVCYPMPSPVPSVQGAPERTLQMKYVNRTRAVRKVSIRG